MDSCHDLPVGGFPEVEGTPPVRGEEVLHILVRAGVLPARSLLDVSSSKLPCLDSFRTEDVSIDLVESVPLPVWTRPVERIRCPAVIKARKGFLDPSPRGVASSLPAPSSIGLCGAVTRVGLVWPLSVRDWRDVAPSLGREGYRVPPKSGERVVAVVAGWPNPNLSPRGRECLPDEVSGGGVDVFVLDVDVVPCEGIRCVLLVESERSLSVSGVPGSGGVFGVWSGCKIRSSAPWV